MLDLKLWSKFYWENDTHHWKNIAHELSQNEPYDYAMQLCKRIQKINDDYFQECSEGSPGYKPTVALDKKYKILKKDLGQKLNQISIKEWAKEVGSVGEKAVLFFYYFAKQTQLEETNIIIPYIDNYNEIIIEHLKNNIIELNNKMTDKVSISSEINNELERILQHKTNKASKFIINFYKKERKEDWFKQSLNKIIEFKTFFYFNMYLVEETKEDLNRWTQFLIKNTTPEKLIQFNAILISHLDFFDNKERLTSFSNKLPIDYSEAFKKIIFSDINTMSLMEEWYALVVRDKNNEKEKLFFEAVWHNQEKTMRLTTKLIPESVILDFIANKMSCIYTKQELDDYDFTKSLIVNDNIQETMVKKLSYYYLENKLNYSHIQKNKSKKI